MKSCPTCNRQNPDDCTWCPECATTQRSRKASPAELLEPVVDRDIFIEFATSLAEEREEVEQMERSEPARYQLGGAHDWQNGSITSFLYSSLGYFDAKPFHTPEPAPSWRMMAELLYYGKIYE